MYIFLAVLVAGGAAWQVSRVKAGKVPKPTGRIVTVKRGDLAVKVSETGSLEPVTQVEVKSRVAGRVQKIFVKEGDFIKAGTLIAIVDPTEVAREAERIKGQLAAAQAGLVQAQENYELTRKQNLLAVTRAQAGLQEAKMRLVQTSAPTRSQDVESAQVAVLRAQAQLDDARRSMERKKSLVAKGFIAQAEADASQVSVTLAEADVNSAKQRVSLLKEGTRHEDIDTARASVATARVSLQTEQANMAQGKLRLRDVERARAEVAQIENQLAQQNVQLKETRIVAPVSGEVVGKFVEEGELIASATAGFAQGAALVRIADLSHMRVKVNVNEVDVARLRVGLPVEIHVDGVTGKTFRGTVNAISPSSQDSKSAPSNGSGSSNGNSVVRFEVKIEVTTPDARLRPGMTASADILVDQHKNTILLPAEALRPKNTVLRVGGTIAVPIKEAKTLTLGLRTDATVEVLSGLNVGDTVEVPKVEAADRRKVNFDGPNN